jgi:hypothetical protein
LRSQRLKNYTNIEKVVFTTTSSITIRPSVFEGCTNLKTLQCPASTNFTTIEEKAFYGCTSLTGFDVSGITINLIGNYAFGACPNLTETGINNIASIGGCTKMSGSRFVY